MRELPTGTVTFLFTDLEGSTRLWEQHPDAMRDALARHDEILRDAVEKHEGCVVKTTGDGLHAVFATAADGVAAAVDAQRALALEPWSLPEGLRVRMGVHTGEADLRDGDYYGTAVNRAARVAAVAHGGQIVCSNATEELARDHLTADAVLDDLGEHQLRDLTRRERLFQIAAEGLRTDFPPVRSLDSYPTNLPVQVTSFVGRGRTIEEVSAALDGSRIVTLTGVGGVGKTRLALQVAAEVLPRFPDGAWFAELAPVSDAEAVVDAVAAAVNTPASGDAPMEDLLVADLQRRRALIVLDNCEHIVDRVASLASRIVRECPDVVLLCTSREGLAVSGERIYAVPVLVVPEVDADVDLAGDTESVQLFAERATAVRGDFAITSENIRGVVAICRRLDGVPLALELAAARVTSLHPAQIAERLDERFRLLTAGRRSAVERHQTLRATIDWSYDLLTQTEQTALNRMAVFSGGCHLDAAEAVVAGGDVEHWDVLDLLGRLVEQSLVLADESGAEARYRLLETIRQYAAEQLAEQGDTELTLERHARHYRELASAIGIGLQGPDDATWAARYEAELENLRSAVTWFAQRDDATDALGIVFDLSPLKWIEATQTLDDLAIAALEAPSARAHVLGPSALVLAAERAMRYGDETRAEELLTEAASAQSQLETQPHPVAPYVRFRMAMTLGDLSETERQVAEIWAHPDVAASDYLKTWAFMVDGSTLALTGRSVEAEACFRQAAEVARRTSNPFCIASAVNAHGWMLRERDPEAALILFDEVLAMGTRAGAFPLATTSANRFVVRARLGEVRAAVEDGRQTLAALDRTNERNYFGGVLCHCATALAELDELGPAAELFGASASISPVVTNPFYGWAHVQPKLEESLGRARYDECVARGHALDKDDALAVFRTALDAIEARLGNHD